MVKKSLSHDILADSRQEREENFLYKYYIIYCKKLIYIINEKILNKYIYLCVCMCIYNCYIFYLNNNSIFNSFYNFLFVYLFYHIRSEYIHMYIIHIVFLFHVVFVYASLNCIYTFLPLSVHFEQCH